MNECSEASCANDVYFFPYSGKSAQITELIEAMYDPFILPINPSSPTQLVFLRFLDLWILFFSSHFFLSRSDDSTWFFLSCTEKRRHKKKWEEAFMPRWRYHKMIITTKIWWVHNWLNIKNCSEIFGSLQEVEEMSETRKKDVLLCREFEFFMSFGEGVEEKGKGKIKEKNVHLLCSPLEFFTIP